MVDLAVLDLWSDLMILKVFSKLKYSVILWYANFSLVAAEILRFPIEIWSLSPGWRKLGELSCSVIWTRWSAATVYFSDWHKSGLVCGEHLIPRAMKWVNEGKTGRLGTSALFFFIYFGSPDSMLQWMFSTFYSVFNTLTVWRHFGWIGLRQRRAWPKLLWLFESGFSEVSPV